MDYIYEQIINTLRSDVKEFLQGKSYKTNIFDRRNTLLSLMI